MRYTFASVLAFAAASTQDIVVHAFPTGAGECDSGGAVGNNHIWRDEVVTGSLSDGGLQVTVGGVALRPGSEAEVTTATPIQVELSAADSSNNEGTKTSSFRGFLFRLSSQDGRSTAGEMFPITGDDQAQISDYCTAQSVGGVTHTSRDVKTSASAILETLPNDSEETMILEVTSVKVNTAAPSLSEWYYSNYTIKVKPNVDSLPPGDNSDGLVNSCKNELQAQAECLAAHPTQCAPCTNVAAEERAGTRFLMDERMLGTSCSNPVHEGYICKASNCCDECAVENLAASNCLSGCQTDCTNVPSCTEELDAFNECFDASPSCYDCEFDPFDLETTDFCTEFDALSCSQASCCAECKKEIFLSANCLLPQCNNGFGEQNCNNEGTPSIGTTANEITAFSATAIFPLLVSIVTIVVFA